MTRRLTTREASPLSAPKVILNLCATIRYDLIQSQAAAKWRKPKKDEAVFPHFRRLFGHGRPITPSERWI